MGPAEAPVCQHGDSDFKQAIRGMEPGKAVPAFGAMHPSRSVQAILTLARWIPGNVRRSFTGGLFHLCYGLLLRQRIISLHNLQCAFPDKSFGERQRIARRMCGHFGRIIADFADIQDLSRQYVDDRVDVEGIEHLREALEMNKGVLLFSAHFGNWELGAAVVALLLKPIVMIYRRFDNPVIEDLVTSVRASAGVTSLSKNNAMRKILRSLQDNEIIFFLIDQNVACNEGVFVDYFGRPACTSRGLARIALHTGAPVLPLFMIARDNGRYRLVIGERVPAATGDEREGNVEATTQRYTAIIEKMVRKFPDQWLWMHQRWKTRACQLAK